MSSLGENMQPISNFFKATPTSQQYKGELYYQYYSIMSRGRYQLLDQDYLRKAANAADRTLSSQQKSL